jgi:putative salt-induced outer membrane protein YdiY
MTLVDRALRSFSRTLVVALLVLASLPLCAGRAATSDPERAAWKGSGQLSLLTASGNSRSKSGSVRFELVNDWPEVDRLTFTAGVLYNESDGEKTAEAEYLNGKYDYFHTPDTYSLYYLGVERDEFAGFDYRVTARIGLGHQFIESDNDTLDGEAGFDYVYEEKEPKAEAFPVARLYGKYTHKFAERISFLQDLELLENLTDTEDYRVNTLTALEVGLNSRLSFKTAVTVKYDHQPVEDNQTLDYFTETALVLNF